MPEPTKWLANVATYRFVFAVGKMNFKQERRNMRIVLYGARDVNGLLHPEFNGVAVLDEDIRHVICDDIFIVPGKTEMEPTKWQKDGFEAILSWKWSEFTKNINMHPRSRGAILEVVPKL